MYIQFTLLKMLCQHCFKIMYSSSKSFLCVCVHACLCVIKDVAASEAKKHIYLVFSLNGELNSDNTCALAI